MKHKTSSIKANLIYGLFVVIPVGIIIVVISKLVGGLNLLAKHLGFESATGAGLGVIASIILLLLICYAVGALVHTRLGTYSFQLFEDKLLKQFPGYKMFSNRIKGFADNSKTYQPASISIGPPGAALFGFIMEENNDGTLTVFVPMAPVVMVGNIHIVEPERVTLLDAEFSDVTKCMREFGLGSGKVLESKHETKS